MTPGTKVRTKVEVRDAVSGVIAPAKAEGVVQFIHQNVLYPVEVGFYGNYPTCLYRAGELETIE